MATIFAVSLVPVLIAAGIGVDMSRAMSSRSNLQDALDATALALAHLPAGTPQQDIDSKVQAWLTANLHDSNMGSPTVTAKLSKGEIVLDATAQVKTTLTAIAGYQVMPIAAHSTVKWGLGKVEVALVLDNTGSMLQNNKIGKLKTAALALVNALDTTNDKSVPDSVRISVVPFSMTVRLGTATQVAAYSTASWLDPEAQALGPSGLNKDIFQTPHIDRLEVFDDLGKTWAGCVESRVSPYDVTDTAPNVNNVDTLFFPFFAPDEPDDSYWYPNNYLDDYISSTNWQVRQGNIQKYTPTDPSGCKTKKNKGVVCSKPGYTPVVKTGSSPLTGYEYGPNAGCSMAPILRLTSDISAVKSKINAMQAVGETNIPMGLMWGWHTLSPNAPFADGVAYGTPDVEKIVVLLTDGDNTMTDMPTNNDSVYSGAGYIWQGRFGITSGSATQRTAAMDSKLTTLCNNMKTAKITVFTVRIDVSGSSPQVLKACASSPEKFYDIDSADLSKAFENIAGAIGKLRIAQ